MVQNFVVVKNNIIIAEFSTSDGENGIKMSMGDIAYDEIREVPYRASEPRIMRNTKEFDKEWNLRPLTERINDGLSFVPFGHVIDGEIIREMNIKEKVDAGIIEIPDGMKIDGKNIVPMNDDELIKNKIKTKEEIDSINKQRQEDELIAQKIYEMAKDALKKEGKIK